MLTLGQVKNSSVANIAGVNVQDPQFIAYVNEAVQILMDIGSWWGTVQAMVGIAYDGCLVWPRKVDAVLGMRVHHQHIQLANHWYEFVPMGEEHLSWARRWGQGCHDMAAEFSGTTPLFWPIDPTTPTLLQFTCDNPADYGKTITVYGRDTNGQQLFATRPDGSVQRGVLLTLAAAAPVTVALSGVDTIFKDVTVGSVRAWSYNIATGTTIACVGIYGGGQTNPQFLFSRIQGIRASHPAGVSALVRLGFEQVAQDSDIIPLDCLDAIKSMVQSIKLREAGGDGRLPEAEAIRRLNMQLRKRFPMEQFVMSFRPFGNDTLEKQHIGSML